MGQIKEVTAKDIADLTGLVEPEILGADSQDLDTGTKFMVDIDSNDFGYISMYFGSNKAGYRYNMNTDIFGGWGWTEEEAAEVIHVLAGDDDNGCQMKNTVLAKKSIIDLETLKAIAMSFFRMRAMHCGIMELTRQDSSAARKLLKRDARDFLEICNEIEKRNNVEVEE